ncbi:hypothetical protein NLJ89_g10665 [Agrocybe chaxingu]|uniref:Uncharacterized protein n=1 Tax=Agrocybe chaxingu TaxID=84603 RepID=A0A9W8JXQ1_9AGAR|nr:hypothetical protein NLJ89_g10665 [Agrocybe chaxingu]
MLSPPPSPFLRRIPLNQRLLPKVVRPKKFVPPPCREKTAEERAAAHAKYVERRQRLYGLPCAIDVWLRHAMEQAAPPMVPANANSTALDSLLLHDMVECFMKVDRTEPDNTPNPRQPNELMEGPTFDLEVSSPSIVMANFEGEEGDINCPDWVTMVGTQGKTFFQPRTFMLEVLATVARQENTTGGKNMLDWCKCVSFLLSSEDTDDDTDGRGQKNQLHFSTIDHGFKGWQATKAAAKKKSKKKSTATKVVNAIKKKIEGEGSNATRLETRADFVSLLVSALNDVDGKEDEEATEDEGFPVGPKHRAPEILRLQVL